MTKRSIPPEHGNFVARSLERRLVWPPGLPIEQVVEDLKAKGETEVVMTGTDGDSGAFLPFLLNIAAKTKPTVTTTTIQKTFRASLKFGSKSHGKTCVVLFDSNQDFWHLHQFDEALGHEVHHQSAVRMPELVLADLGDAVRYIVHILCDGGWDNGQDAGFTYLSTIPHAGANLPLVVRRAED